MFPPGDTRYFLPSLGASETFSVPEAMSRKHVRTGLSTLTLLQVDMALMPIGTDASSV